MKPQRGRNKTQKIRSSLFEIGMVGLGRMGGNMALNLIDNKHKVVGYNRSPESTKKLAKNGLIPAYSLKEMVDKLPERKIIWLMVPAGKPVDMVIKNLIPMLNKEDIIVDGGNSFFKDSVRRHLALRKYGIDFLDCGTSGGIEGARKGACMMVGGKKEVFIKVEKLFKDMCVKNGYGHMGKAGAGHFVKMVHNGIEYGMMGAIAEGVQAIRDSRFKPDLKEVVKVYAHGSIIESRLVSWLHDSFTAKSYLQEISGEVPKGETEEEMKKLEKMAEMKILHQAILMRQKTRKKRTFAGKLIAAMRNQFGGHAVKKK